VIGTMPSVIGFSARIDGGTVLSACASIRSLRHAKEPPARPAAAEYLKNLRRSAFMIQAM
jgi:hypothetical protein